MSPHLKAPLIALAASIGLIGVYLAFGGATYDPTGVADPCEQRESATDSSRPLFEAIALSSLDGAACELGVDREELALVLADEEATQQFAERNEISDDDINDAVRAGLVRAVDDAAAAGRIDGIDEEILRYLAEHAPVGTLITALQALPGDDSVQGLLEQLGSIPNIDLPDVPTPSDIPGLDQLQDLLPITGAPERRRAAWRRAHTARNRSYKTGGDLLSQAVSHQVPSALRGLTSLFGMGRGVSPSLLPPN